MLKSMSYFLLVTCFVSFTFDWELAKSDDGINVYTKKVAGKKMKACKTTMEVAAPISKFVEILKDVDNMTNWMDNTAESTLVKSVSEDEYYIYFVTPAPWPVTDRDYVVRYTWETIDEGHRRLHVDSASDLVATKSNYVRIKEMEATWDFVSTADGTTKVTQEFFSEPGGSIPDWLANSAIVESPFNSMKNLKAKVLE